MSEKVSGYALMPQHLKAQKHCAYDPRITYKMLTGFQWSKNVYKAQLSQHMLEETAVNMCNYSNKNIENNKQNV